MRRPTSALTAAALGTALTASALLAQQPSPSGGDGMPPIFSPMAASRGARHLLRNGWDYLSYQEYERALAFFREAEGRKAELNDAERQALAQGIDRARRGMREAANAPRPAFAKSGPNRRPGAMALTRPEPAAAPAPEPIQLAGAAVAVASAPASAATMEQVERPALPTGPAPSQGPATAPAPTPAPPVPAALPEPRPGARIGPADPGPAARARIGPARPARTQARSGPRRDARARAGPADPGRAARHRARGGPADPGRAARAGPGARASGLRGTIAVGVDAGDGPGPGPGPGPDRTPGEARADRPGGRPAEASRGGPGLDGSR